jgi:hypothetical protein
MSGIETRLVQVEEVKAKKFIPRPSDTFVQLIGNNGTFIFKEGPFYRAVVKMPKTADLAELEEYCQLKVARVDLDLFMKIEDFFVRVYAKHKSEAIVLLYVSIEKNTWRARVPEQVVSGASAKYELKEIPMSFESEGTKFFLFGSIHSHGCMTAFHSGTDNADECHFDGLHVTIGNVDKSERSYAARYMIHGSEFTTNIKEVVAFPVIPKVTCEDAWLEKVSEPVHEFTEFGGVREGGGLLGWEHYSKGKAPGAPFSPFRTPIGLTTPSKNQAKKLKKKDRWKRRADTDHCYTCEHYTGDCQCKIMQRTTPMSSCGNYLNMLDVPDLWEEEAVDWLRFNDPVAAENLKKKKEEKVNGGNPSALVAP